jgi:threonine dehydrogenase-like Zn-dependent dehydrogenase
VLPAELEILFLESYWANSTKKKKKIIVTAGNEESIQQLIEIGINANQIINYKQENLAESILEINHNQKFDIVIDAVGNAILRNLCRSSESKRNLCQRYTFHHTKPMTYFSELAQRFLTFQISFYAKRRI